MKQLWAFKDDAERKREKATLNSVIVNDDDNDIDDDDIPCWTVL